ncbi:KIR protein [Plasmodium knowlesi strain H]|uniref:KIR protein n=3 Tax=Plasmodium knowlesi TaxID=5850 RepID=A0A1A7VKK4_PLAKH|nr:KIR protein [Plasmodium knowlesi strain H]OTN66040.1 KIR protein [Plasmodium knowlesi]CAA9987822.1 KIR protein [Plasmodium knowlesi strain H]SBO22375.1 KIR protein [Plasmodium knowlesi strain H]SBO29508.1 KIR protein [Plasmodium knowlesi strain H]VVS77296.1 KIR protein [Plasmodium knowlesi strain H]
MVQGKSSLPSAQIYEELNKAKDTHSDVAIRDAERSSLSSPLGGEDKVLSVLAAWKYVAQKKKGEGNNQEFGKYCNFFYYWLGDKIPSSVDAIFTFANTMGTVYGVLMKSGIENGCPIINTSYNITREIFTKRKKVFDYYEDYQTIFDQLPGGQNWCGTDYKEYMETLSEVYQDAIANCGNDSSDPCCAKYNSENIGSNKYKELLGKDCTAAASVAGRELSGLQGTSTIVSTDSTTSIPGAVGGGLVSVALPTIGFFLYKYTNIFDGIKKSLFGGSNRNRGRRSTGRHQHFDGLDSSTMGDDSSTLGDDGSTTLGGGGGESSTLGGSSTDISTIYNEPPRRPTGRTRTGTNNRRPGNIRYYAT